MDCNDLHNHILLRHLYGETNENEQLLAQQTIAADWEARDTYADMQTAYDALNLVPMRKPRQSSIDLIMQYNSRTNKELEEFMF